MPSSSLTSISNSARSRSAPDPAREERLKLVDPATDQCEPRDEHTPTPGFDTFRWLVGYTRAHARRRNLLMCLVCLRACQLSALAWATGAIISGPITGRSLGGLALGVVGYVLLAAFTQGTLHFRQRFALELGEAVLHDLRNDIFSHVQQMTLSFFHRVKLGRIISHMTSDAEAIRTGVQDVVFTSLVGIGQMLVATALMLWLDPVMFLVVAAMAPILWWVNVRFRGSLSRAHLAVQESFSRVTSRLVEAVHGVQVTQSFARQEVSARRFRDLVTDHSAYNLEAARIGGLFAPLLELNTQLFLASLLVLGGYRVLDPSIAMPIGALIQFMFLANIFFQPITGLGDQYNQALLTMAGAERLRQFLAVEPDWVDPPQARPLEQVRGEVIFDDVHFAYQADRPVLDGVSFHARPGECIALIGHTGSGKSTIVNLISKFYLPTAGQILIDGCDLCELQTASLRAQIGIVPQHNFLFTGTVADNIRLARPDATDEEVLGAVDRLGCLPMISCLPQGLQTEVGEAGKSLSLGQRQLVCFARAMLADPAILILDEATSAVDVYTEQQIQRALAELLLGRTSFVIAHRLSTIRSADQVLVLDRGRIIERGRHADLIAAGGAYAAAYGRHMPSQAA